MQTMIVNSLNTNAFHGEPKPNLSDQHTSNVCQDAAKKRGQGGGGFILFRRSREGIIPSARTRYDPRPAEVAVAGLQGKACQRCA